MSHMDRALSLARRSLGAVSPNPSVGAVIVKDGIAVGEGCTQPPGREHAEIIALQEAGASSEGATLYSTLEPCNHQGRTPPCTAAIVRAGISEVRVAALDPNPDVAGGGVGALEEAGLRVRVGEGEKRAKLLMEAYLKYVETGMPFVTAKFAMTLDGKIATRTGDSKWISGDKARWEVHGLRHTSDAIMVGINTAIADNPQLTARDERGKPRDRQPLRVIIDGKGRMPLNARMLSEPGETLVAVSTATEEARESLAEAGFGVVEAAADDGTVDLTALMSHLAGEMNITSLCVEGGASILGSLFDQGLVDKVIAFVSPTIIGGGDAPSPVAGQGVDLMSDAIKLERVKWDRFGRDMAITGYC
jgi:diaminohydroxyphosphoribosylaminopyrimidine deaminase / 5-amino-6-(5-phosphoribosylamino)uracil reductase